MHPSPSVLTVSPWLPSFRCFTLPAPYRFEGIYVEQRAPERQRIATKLRAGPKSRAGRCRA
jgi:hypothetical protein